MKRRYYFLILCMVVLFSLPAFSSITIEQCVEKAQKNYPLIKKYSLISFTKEIEISEINSAWYPRIGLSAQFTGQNAVPSYPDALSDVLKQMGQEVEGLGKIQYKVGLEINQTIWDGGVSKIRHKIVNNNQDMQRASLDVEMYAVRERVENLFFAILLLEKQIDQNEISKNILNANLDKLHSMLRNGVAMQSDVDMVEAQLLALSQNIELARNSMVGYRKVLELFMGETIADEKLIEPQVVLPVGEKNERPELNLFSTRVLSNKLADELYKTSLMPKVSLFAQTYYGYPGFDYFKSMMQRSPSFNILAGLKISWNIDSFYMKKNNSKKTVLNMENIEVEKETFLFNTSLQTSTQWNALEGLRKVMADDSKIIDLRVNVRRAAESQLNNGVIDATTLLSKISDENIAILNSQYHHIKYLQEFYKLKYLLNQ